MSTGYASTGPQIDVGNHWLLRFVAALIDSIPWSIVAVAIWWALAWNTWSPLWRAHWVWWGSWFIWPFFYGFFWIVYCAVMESSSGSTLGKKVMGLKVQMLNGDKVPFGKAFVRNISKIFWIIFLIDVLLAFATSGPDPRQRYFDRIAGTTVVSEKEAFATVLPPPPPPPPS